MLRLLVVLAIVALAGWYLAGGVGGGGAPQAPEARHAEETGKARALESQLQQDAQRDLEALDAGQ